MLGIIRTTLEDIGLNPRRVTVLRHFRKYRAQRAEWLRQGGRITREWMILSDYSDTAGSARGHYFHQDLQVARLVFEAAPRRHIDVASRIDGFVAHLAAFREVEVVDVRPLPDSVHGNIRFVQADLMRPQSLGTADSVSCLHAIEHFGLGRYSDPIDIHGHDKGVANLVALTEPGGRLYLSFPIGAADEVQFNAQRVFHPLWVLRHPAIAEHMTLERFDWVDDHGDLNLGANPAELPEGIAYGCGIYTFRRHA